MASKACYGFYHSATKISYCFYFPKVKVRSICAIASNNSTLSNRSCCPYIPHSRHKFRYNCLQAVCTDQRKYLSVHEPVEQLNLFQKFKKILNNFYLGGKVLYKDIKVTLQIKRKLRINHDNHSSLDRKEQWIMFKTQKSLKKILPIIILSCFPVIGYLGPIIGFLRPRYFLSHHFWTAKQKQKFQVLDDIDRTKYHSVILRNIANEVEKITDTEQQQLMTNLLKANIDNITTNEALLKTLPSFSDGVLKFDNLERDYLKDLCSFWLLSSWLPTSWLQKRLIREMEELHKDDLAINREGITTLTDKELDEACHVRGLNTSLVSSQYMVLWLQDWIDLTKRIEESDTSFLAHIAVFKMVPAKDQEPRENN